MSVESLYATIQEVKQLLEVMTNQRITKTYKGVVSIQDLVDLGIITTEQADTLIG